MRDHTIEDLIGGRYRILDKVGVGSFGEVWLAEDVKTSERVAVKTLRAEVAQDSAVMARFRREAHFLGRICSDYVARIIDFVSTKSGMVLVMEFVDGELLSDIFEHKRLSIEETLELGIDLLTGLRDLHTARVIHRDLKPANIMMRRVEGGRRRAIIFDFSLSLLDGYQSPVSDSPPSSMQQITGRNTMLGTLPYMSPEQLVDSHQVTQQSDIYSIGAILYRALTGSYPFNDVLKGRGLTARKNLAAAKLAGEVPPIQLDRDNGLAQGLAAIIATALRRRPAERYSSADEMLRAMVDLYDLTSSDGEVGTRGKTFPTKENRRVMTRTRSRLGTILLVAGILAGGVAVGTLASRASRRAGTTMDVSGGEAPKLSTLPVSRHSNIMQDT